MLLYAWCVLCEVALSLHNPAIRAAKNYNHCWKQGFRERRDEEWRTQEEKMEIIENIHISSPEPLEQAACQCTCFTIFRKSNWTLKYILVSKISIFIDLFLNFCHLLFQPTLRYINTISIYPTLLFYNLKLLRFKKCHQNRALNLRPQSLLSRSFADSRGSIER